MTSGDIKELQFIAPIENLYSIVSDGIMSHERIGSRPHRSVADREVQARREEKRVPPSQRSLHSYANLYLNARNPMMFRVAKEMGQDALCIVCVDPAILHGDGVMIADHNAATTSCTFYGSPGGLAHIDARDVFVEWWTTDESKRKIMAEVLVPDVVLPRLIMGIRVGSKEAQAAAITALRESWLRDHVRVDSHMFFPPDPQ